MRTLCFAAIVVAAAALANHKLVHGARHKDLEAETPVESRSPLLLEALDDTPIWGRCAADQLDHLFKPPNADHCLQANLFYVRIPKCGSTSFSSVIKRIGARAGASGVEGIPTIEKEYPEPFISSFHEEYMKMQDFIQSKVKPIVKVTMVREPVARYLSHYYYVKVTQGERLKDVTFLDWIQERKQNFQYEYVRRDKNQEDMESILNEYSLVGVTERFEESTVLLMEMLGLNYCDIMYSDGKISGEAVSHKGKPLKATLPLSEQPREVQDYVASAEFHSLHANEMKLYAAANDRLDKLINRVGRSKFEAKVEDFKKWRNWVLKSRCKDEVTNQGNSSEWFEQNCYANDVGCGYKCFDQLCKEQGEVIDHFTRAKFKENLAPGEPIAAQLDLGDNSDDQEEAHGAEEIIQPLLGEDAP